MYKFTHPDKANKDHKWVTSEGDIVNQLTSFDVYNKYATNSLVAVINGRIHAFSAIGESNNLYMRDAAKHIWINIYRKGVIPFDSKKEADLYTADNRIACVKVNYFEGEGL